MLNNLLREIRRSFSGSRRSEDDAPNGYDLTRSSNPVEVPLMYAIRRIARSIVGAASQLVPQDERTFEGVMALMIPNISANDIERFRNGYFLADLPPKNNKDPVRIFQGAAP